MVDNEDFLLKEYEQISINYHISTDRRYELIKLYFLIVALPISIFSIVYNFMQSNDVIMLYGKIYACLFLFVVSLSGLLIFNSLISIHITKVIYAKTINKIRGYFVENDNTKTMRNYIILPINDDKPLFLRYESLFYDCMLISIINSLILGISFFIILNYYKIENNYAIIIAIPIFFIHLIIYYYRLNREDTMWIKKRDIFK